MRGRKEMEDAELEEGEACSYQNNGDFDSNIDPDVALSYIDVKIQDVLGHFQKDFEGGLSVENLGSKYGGYGSFLPSYQRSPVLSHSRTLLKGQNCSTSRSPNKFQQEVGHINSVVSSTTPQSIRPGPPSTSSTSLPIIKGPNLNELSKQEVCTSFQHIEELASGYGCGNNKSTTSSDQISLKVLIKVGSDNLPTRKNDAIYSGLGLDVSPSSSLDESPSESEGISRELQDDPFESPTSILQMMTSFPVHGGLLLSPLHDDLIHLTQTGKPGRDKKSTRVQPYKQDHPLAGGASLKGGQMLVEKKMSKDTNDFLCHPKNINRKGFLNSITTSTKTLEIDAKACEELVSDALKLPLLSNSYTILGESTKGMNRPSETLVVADKVVTKDNHFFDQPKEGPAVEPPLTMEDVKQTNGSYGKVREPKKPTKFDDISIFAKKSGESKREKTIDLIEAASMGNNASNGDQIEPLNLNTNHKTAPHAHGNLKHTLGKDNLFREGKKKSKFSQTDCIPNGEVSKLSVKSGSSGSKSKSINKVDNISTRTEIEDLKPHDFRKTKDRYRDFFGELEEDDNLIDESETPFEDQLNHSDVCEKPTSVISASKERLSVEKIGKSLASKAFPEVVVTDVAPAAVDNVVPQDNWVGCDRCQQWRLLPLGRNPSSLPEKWVCSMLDWLPGMNLCDFSEEETTKALIARFQAPAAPEGNIYSNLSGVMPGVANARPSGQSHRHYDFNALPGGGKKKHGAKERPSMTLKGEAPQLSNSKKHEGAMKNRSLEDVNQLPIVDEANFHHLNKSGDVPVEKHKLKYKEKQEFDILSEEGTTKSSKSKFRKEKEHDYSRPSKKVRTDGLYLTDEDQMSGHSGPVVKVGPTLSIVFPSVSGGTSKSKNTDHYSKDSKYNTNVVLQVPNDKRENKLLGASYDDSLGGGNSSTKSSSKKRKVKASPGIQTNTESLSGSGHLLQKRGHVTEFSDNDHRKKEKKAKLSKQPPGKESGGRKEKKGSHSKNWLHEQDVGSTLSHRSLDGADSLKRDFGAIQPSLVATSSSSKISGSHKTKSSFQDIKGSPVESVSSLPMRIPNQDKILRSSRDGKDFLDGGRTRCSDGEEEDGGSDRSGTGSKKNSVVAHHRPLKSPLFDTMNKGASNNSGKKSKAKEKSSSDLPNCDLPNDILGNLGIDHQHSSKPWAEQVQNEDRRPNEMRYKGNETYPVKSGNDLSSQSKDKSGSYCLDVGIDKDKVPYSHDNLQGGSPPHFDLKVKNGKHKLPNNSRIKSGDAREDGSGNLSIERGKRESELNIVKHEGPDSTVDRNSKENVVFYAGKNQQDDCNGTASKKSHFQKNDQLDKVNGKSIPAQLPTSGELRNQMLHGPHSVAGGKGNVIDILQVDASKSNDVLKGKKHVKNRHKEAQTNGSRHSTPNERVPIDAPSPARRDSSNQAATKAMKEAKDLKHLADRFKNTGSNHESIGLYFQAALKFLYGASLLESSNNETAKQSMQIYSSTAKLCEFCAHEYEKIKDMAAAALAYKCMEVAYMRVIYSSHNSAIRDRNDLQQIALKMGPSGESPSPASDIDNVNNPAAADKVAQSKGVGLSQATGSHVIPAKSHPNFLRLLSYAQDINFAMEASRKSRIAFAAANASSVGTTIKEGISCIKTALDFNFQDVEGLLALVRIAMEAINN